MWNVSEIKNKQKYVIQRLKVCNDPKERERLEFSFCTYHNILEGGFVKNLKVSDFLMNALTLGNFGFEKQENVDLLVRKLILDKENYLDNEYFNFLIDVSCNVYDSLNNSYNYLFELESDNNSLIQMSKSFYENLGNDKILDFSNQFFLRDDNLQFNNSYLNLYNDCQGITFFDPAFDTAYCGIKKNNCILDYLALNHEVMHYIDFKIGKKLHSNNYYGFQEVPTYTIDFLFIDYLEEQGFGEHIFDLKSTRESYFKKLSSYFKYSFSGSNVSKVTKYGDISFKKFSALLEIESFVIAYILYEQIKQDKEKGLNNLIKFMETPLPKDKKPDFSFIGISDEDILDVSGRMNLAFAKHRNR